MDERNKEQKQYFIETIAKFCDKCGNAYSINDLEIIQETPISSIIHFSCKNCKASHIATFLKPMGISNRMPVNTDVGIEEIRRVMSKGGVTTDEVLDIYLFLKENSQIKV
ncbi:hypothetical protein K8R20_00190 [bacterium]|nr:hypothetical protein [bacterium]